MFQHTVLFLYRDWLEPRHKAGIVDVWEGIRAGCRSIRHLDHGEDLLGGSSQLLTTPPWRRIPRWRSRSLGPPSNYDYGANLDFDDLAGFARYVECPAHHTASGYNERHCQEELTARVQWEYDGPIRRIEGGVRHTALYLWAETAPDTQRKRVCEAFLSLQAAVGGVRSLELAEDLKLAHVPEGEHTRLLYPAGASGHPEAWRSLTNFDLILDVIFDDLASAESFLAHPARVEAESVAAAATLYEWTARLTKRMA